MKLVAALSLGIASVALAPVSASAATLFSDNFQTNDLSGPNWFQNGSGQIVAAPVGGGNALHFTGGGSGGDLFSQIIPGTGAGTYRLTVEYLCQNANGCAGFIGLYPGNNSTNPQTNGSDNWLVTDAAGNYPTAFKFATNVEGFVTNTFDFSVDSNTPFGLKLEDFTGGTDGVAGNAYFRNLSLSSPVPEPATWALMLLGFGMIGFAIRKRSNVRTTFSYA